MHIIIKNNIKKITPLRAFFGVVLMMSLVFAPLFSYLQTAHAAPNYQMNYQGKLTNASNVAVADGTYNMRFWLLTSPSIATTSALWTETLTSGNKVQVTNGLFSVMLGSTTALTGVDFNQTLYLGVEIGGTSTPTWDGEMSPRKILGAVPAAFEAKNASTVGGVASTSFLRKDQADTASGLLTFTGGFISNASSTITNLSTLIATTTTLVINGESFTDLTGSGFINSANALTCATSNSSTFGCLTSSDWTLFNNKISSTSIDTSAELAALMTDETGTVGNLVFSTNPLLAGFRSNASSTIGDGTATGGLTVFGNSTTTGNSYVAGLFGIGTTSPSATLAITGSGTTKPLTVASSTGATLFTILANGNVGIGSSTPNSRLTVSGGSFDLLALNSEGVAGSELITAVANRDFSSANNWTGTNWSVGGGVATHVAGNNTYSLANGFLSAAPVAGNYYQITFSINTTAIGTLGVSVSFGGTIAGPTYGVNADGSQTAQVVVVQAADTGALTFAPNDATWTGTIDDVSVKRITPASIAQTIRNSDGTAGVEIRAGGIGLNNTFVGKDSGFYNTTGSSNSAQGVNALYSNTTGSSNSAQGDSALYSNTTGSSNSAQGYQSLYSNTTGSYNSAQGHGALTSNTTGFYNSAQGVSALSFNTTGSSNSAQGAFALRSNTTGSQNSAQGVQALYSNTTGSFNSAHGADTLLFNTTGSSNSAQGVNALYSNTTGSSSSAFGYQAGYNILTSNNNTLIGTESGYSSVSASSSNNTLLGYRSGYGMGDTVGNLFLGYQAASSTTLGNYNILLGYNSNLASTTGSNQLNIGNLIYGTNLGVNGSLSAGNVGIGTSTPSRTLTIAGSLGLTGALYDGVNSAGTNGMVLQTTGTGVTWTATSSLGIAGVSGGTNGYLARFTGATTLATGLLRDNGTVAGVNATSSSYTFNIQGSPSVNPFNVASSSGTSIFAIDTNGILNIRSGTSTQASTTNIFVNGGTATTTVLRNIAQGFQAFTNVTTGANDNIALGYQALYGSSTVLMTGTDNFVAGWRAGYSNTTGYANVFLGTVAGYSNTTGHDNSFNGYEAGYLNTTGSYNAFTGYEAGYSNTSGSSNTLIGLQSGFSNTSGVNNFFVGNTAGYSNSIGGNNTFHGSGAGYSNVDGSRNLFSGLQSGYSNTSGSDNIALGGASLYSNSWGLSNIAIGSSTLRYADSSSNIALGLQALMGSSTSLMTGSDNFAVGHQAGYSNTSGSANSFIGIFSGRSNTTGAANSFIGPSTGYENTSGSYNTFIGSSAGRFNTDGSYNLFMGVGSGYANTSGSRNTFIGMNAADANTTGSDNIAIGAESFRSNTAGIGNIALGSSTLRYADSSNNIAFGTQALMGSSTALMTGTDNFVAGYQAGLSNTTGSNNFFTGNQAGYSNTTGTHNSFNGFFAGYYNTTGSNNIALGQSSLFDVTTGSGNVAIGGLSQSGGCSTGVGDNNLSMGVYSLPCNNGSNNIGFGFNSLNGTLVTGSNNIGIGQGSLLGATTGSNNMGLGNSAGSVNTTGLSNTYLGAFANTSGTGFSTSTAIGAGAIVGATNALVLGGTGTSYANVGIGTTTPGSTLTVRGTGINNPFLVASSTGTSLFTILANGNVGIGTSTPASTLTVRGTGLNDPFLIASSTGATLVNVLASGRMGIGIAAPTRLLQVLDAPIFGSATVEAYSGSYASREVANFGAGSAYYVGRDTTNDIEFAMGTSAANLDSFVGSMSNHPLDFRTNATEKARITAAGNFGIGTSSPNSKLDVWGNFNVATGSTPALFVNTANSRVGIGTSSPSQNLTVAGNMHLTGALYDSTYNAGTSGMVLQTTGTGATWVATSSLGITGGAGVSGGVLGYATRWLSATTLGTSTLLDDGTVAGINATSSLYSFMVQGRAGTNPFAVASSTGQNMLTVDQLGRLTFGTTTSSNIFLNGGASTTQVANSNSIAIGNEALTFTSTSSATLQNIALGYQALYGSSTERMTGTDNIALGYQAGMKNTTGSFNSFTGYRAGYSNTSGSNNFFTGFQAGLNNTTGSGNSFTGYWAGYSNTVGSYNSFTGYNVGSSNTTGSYNSFIGYEAGLFNTTGSNNSFTGNQAGFSNTTGSDNTAIGGSSLYANTSGNNNIAVGTTSLRYNTTGSSNIALGMFALQGSSTAAMTGSNNIAFGNKSLASNVSGAGNIAMGSSSLQYSAAASNNIAFGTQALMGSSTVLMTGTDNFAAGYQAGYSNTTGLRNSFIGSSAGFSNTTGSYNSFTGYLAGYSNTTGNYNSFTGLQAGGSNTTGSNNSFTGYQAGFSNTTGSDNIAMGALSLNTNSTGISNIAFGTSSLRLTTGSNNLGLGAFAGNVNTTGNSNIYLGAFANTSGSGFSTSTAIGAGAIVGCSNCLVLGGTGANSVNVGIGTTTPFAKFTIQNNYGSTTVLFDIATTTSAAYATSSIFRVNHDGNVGIGTSTPSSRLTIDKSGVSGAVVAGIKQYFGFINSVESAVYYGDETYIVNAPTATSTLVGKMIRIEDNSTLSNTVRGFEAQAYRGTNTKGENTGLSGFGRTFGVRGTTIGDAGNTYLPAGVFAESQGTTQGNALRAYSGTITTESLVSLFHDTSVFSGTGLQMNFGNSGGSFAATSSAKFLDFKVGGTSRFTVTAGGTTTIGDGTTNNKAGLQIGYGGLCVDNDGSCNASTTGQITSVSSATGNSDLAEIYFGSEILHMGEIVSLDGGLSIQKASEENASAIIGVVSTKPGLLLGFDDTSLNLGEEGYPVGLKGRVPVKLSTENGPIKKGDRITISSIPGIGMKATASSRVVGIALEDFDGEKAYSAGFLNQFGDDMVRERITKKVTIDPKTQDGCYNGGGTALGERGCDPDKVKKMTVTITTDDSEYQDMLATLTSEEPQDAVTEDGENTTIGQALMFIDLAWYQNDAEKLMLSELTSTSTLLNGSGTETVWDRLKTLAQGFVDGVLSVLELKANRVEVQSELCVDGVCVNADDLRVILEKAYGTTGGGSGSDNTNTGGDTSTPPTDPVDPTPVDPEPAPTDPVDPAPTDPVEPPADTTPIEPVEPATLPPAEDPESQPPVEEVVVSPEPEPETPVVVTP